MNSSGNWVLKIREKVYIQLAKFPQKDKERIVFVIETLTHNPFVGDIEKIKDGENAWRRRVGNYRIFYEIIISEKVIYVYNIERRTSKTY